MSIVLTKKQEQDKTNDELERMNLYLISQMKRIAETGLLQSKAISDLINLQKVVLNNISIVKTIKDNINEIKRLDGSLVDLNKIQPIISIHRLWEKMYLDNDCKLTIRTTEETRGIGKTSFLAYMREKYNGVYVYDDFTIGILIVKAFGNIGRLHYTNTVKENAEEIIVENKLYVFDENCHIDIEEIKSKFNKYIIIQHID